MMFNCRLAARGDGPELAELRQRFRAESGVEKPAVSAAAFRSAYQRFFERGLRSGERVHWVVEADHRIVACLVVQVVPLVPRPCKPQDAMGIITDNYTLPEYRRHGIGRSLLQSAQDWARDHDLELLVVWPSHEASAWYRRHGFETSGEVLEQRLRRYDDSSGSAD
jgi:ribosomal protein S18 acetylase RimI-like enzyme